MKAFKYADLHIHSVHSDGSDTPENIVIRAAKLGFSCISITDHDTCCGINEAVAVGEKHGVEILPGIEISTAQGDKSVHILGYMMDINSPYLKEIYSETRAGRLERMKRMVAKMNGLGYSIDFSELLEFIGDGTVGRGLLGRFLVEKCYFKSLDAVFEKLLGDDGPVYEPVPVLSPEDVISFVKKAGGVTSLAHPGSTRIDSEIPRLVKAGLGGIEVYNAQHTRDMESRYRELAERHGLLVTGGSDTHGAKMFGRRLGDVKLNYDHVERLKEMAAIAATAAA